MNVPSKMQYCGPRLQEAKRRIAEAARTVRRTTRRSRSLAAGGPNRGGLGTLQGLAAAPPGGMSLSRSRPSRRSGTGVWVAERRLPYRMEYTWVHSAPRYRMIAEE